MILNTTSELSGIYWFDFVYTFVTATTVTADLSKVVIINLSNFFALPACEPSQTDHLQGETRGPRVSNLFKTRSSAVAERPHGASCH